MRVAQPRSDRSAAVTRLSFARAGVAWLGGALDSGKTQDPYWSPVFKGYEPTKKWLAENKPDVGIVVGAVEPDTTAMTEFPYTRMSMPPPSPRERP